MCASIVPGSIGREQAAAPSCRCDDPLRSRRIIRPRKHFDRMPHLGVEPVLRHALTELQDTTGIPCDNELWLHGSQMRHFTVEEGLGGLRMEEVVNASAATAPIAFGDFEQLELRYLLQQGARLLADLLAVYQVTRIVIGHA